MDSLQDMILGILIELGMFFPLRPLIRGKPAQAIVRFHSIIIFFFHFIPMKAFFHMLFQIRRAFEGCVTLLTLMGFLHSVIMVMQIVFGMSPPPRQIVRAKTARAIIRFDRVIIIIIRFILPALMNVIPHMLSQTIRPTEAGVAHLTLMHFLQNVVRRIQIELDMLLPL